MKNNLETLKLIFEIILAVIAISGAGFFGGKKYTEYELSDKIKSRELVIDSLLLANDSLYQSMASADSIIAIVEHERDSIATQMLKNIRDYGTLTKIERSNLEREALEFLNSHHK